MISITALLTSPICMLVTRERVADVSKSDFMKFSKSKFEHFGLSKVSKSYENELWSFLEPSKSFIFHGNSVFDSQMINFCSLRSDLISFKEQFVICWIPERLNRSIAPANRGLGHTASMALTRISSPPCKGIHQI